MITTKENATKINNQKETTKGTILKRKQNPGLYLCSEVLSLRETKLIAKTIQTFGFINILIDKTAPSMTNRRYSLSFSERCEVVFNDLKDNGITDYQIWPVDSSLQKTLEDLKIDTMVFDLEEQRAMDFRLQNRLEKICDIRSVDFGLGDYNTIGIWDLYRFDENNSLRKKLYSDFAFQKFRTKNIRKVGMFGENQKTMGIMREILDERKLDLYDISKKTQRENLGKFMKDGFGKCVYICGFSKLQQKKAFEMMDTSLYFTKEGNLLENEDSETMEGCDVIINPNKSETETKNFFIENVVLDNMSVRRNRKCK